MALITYNSIPVYNYSYVANAVVSSSAEWTDKVRKIPVWTCSDWVTWWDKLNEKYGEEKADAVWTYFWSAGLSKFAGGMGDVRAGSGAIYDSVPVDCRSTNSEFRAFLNKHKKLNDVVYSGIGIITKPIGLGYDVVASVADGVSGLAAGVGKAGKVLKYAIPTLLIVGTLLLALYAYKKVEKA